MKYTSIIEILTPKHFILDGFWFGPRRAKRVIIFVHGLGSSAFQTRIPSPWVDAHTAVITFNNRGHDIIAGIKKKVSGKKGYRRTKGGMAHEVFSESVDDLEGAVTFARRAGAKEIYLAGHSTGCQKSVFYAYKKKRTGLAGIILLAPVSDQAAVLHMIGKAKTTRAERVARAFVRRGKSHDLLPKSVWHETVDAQRFLSLYAQDSVEEIFSYADPEMRPRAYASVKIPLLVVWAEKDEFGSHPVSATMAWFVAWQHSKRFDSVVVKGALHGFQGQERDVARVIKKWVSV